MRQHRNATVKRGALYAEGATKAEAKAKLETQIDWACENHAPRIEFRFDFIIVIAATANGYESAMLDPSGGKHSTKHGDSYGCRTTYGQIELHEVLQSCRVHAAQNAWTLETNDDEHISASGLDMGHAADFARWMTWQRHYAKLRASGLTDAQAYDAAHAAMHVYV